MRVNVVTNINGAGLQRDFELIRDLLVERKHEVKCIQFNAQFSGAPADITIFLEVVVQAHLFHARRNFLIPNPEWYFDGWNVLLGNFETVLCKTRACEKIFKASAKARAKFTGFFSRDLFDPMTPRERRFLHVAGKSQTKNTTAIIEAWGSRKIPYPLTIVSDYYHGSFPNVEFLKRVDDAMLRHLMNTHLFHLMPSMYEGFGHAIHEAFGCKAVVITTNHEPMNEWCAPMELLCEPNGMRQHHAAPLCFVPPTEIIKSAHAAWQLPENRIAEIGDQARNFYLEEWMGFHKNFMAVIG